MNTGTFAGYLGRDAELRNAGGTDVVNFSVGVTIGWGDKKKTLWVGCALWGERAEKLAPYLNKGQAVSVSGDVDLRTYKNGDGETGAELSLNVQRVTLLGKRNGEHSAPAGKSDRPRQWGDAPASTPSQKSDSIDFDDDFPFNRVGA
jgi:single-strand DNA-binding protein